MEDGNNRNIENVEMLTSPSVALPGWQTSLTPADGAGPDSLHIICVLT